MAQTIAARLKKQAKRDDAEVREMMDAAIVIKPTYFDDMRGMYPRLKSAFDRAQLELLRRYASR